ncbi:hypothetical protein AKJ09_02008 [Labilithrix luteola]|uniref:Uncharacterized protein n=1 Tax=Labilithrix luteola TaxID=1391654 RepID=A0A0K1PQF2_9BACT|nr:hypothetical protein AKJ09_02008 [Labilithrix luteola]
MSQVLAIIATKHEPALSAMMSSGGSVQNPQPTDPFESSTAVHAETHFPSPHPDSGGHCSTTSSLHPLRTVFKSREQRVVSQPASGVAASGARKVGSWDGSKVRSLDAHAATSDAVTKSEGIPTTKAVKSFFDLMVPTFNATER